MGNSMGGMIAAAVAAQHGEKVSRLVLVNPVLPRVAGVRGDPDVALTFVAYTIPGVGELLVRARRRLTPRQQIDQQLGLCGIETSRLPPLLVDAMIAQVKYRRTTDWADPAFLAAARSVSRWTLFRAERHRALLDAVRCPTLLVHGTRDRLVPVDLARQAARRRPEWDAAILEGVGHDPQLEVPERFVDVVRRWVGPTADVTEAPPRQA
jgi:pimeloyl-ACP methyl ester carboxylesterase